MRLSAWTKMKKDKRRVGSRWACVWVNFIIVSRGGTLLTTHLGCGAHFAAKGFDAVTSHDVTNSKYTQVHSGRL